jgi:hypothetical protein
MKYAKLIFYILAFAAGVVVGRKTTPAGIQTEYVRLPSIEGSVNSNQLVPYWEEIPLSPFLPLKRDTVYRTVSVDTLAIIEDYIMKRYYDITAFDNSQLGKLRLLPTLQYNKLTDLSWELTPVQKQTTVYKGRVWLPFFSTSYSTFGNASIGGGMFYHNLGLEYQYQRSLLDKNEGHFFSLKYKF